MRLALHNILNSYTFNNLVYHTQTYTNTKKKKTFSQNISLLIYIQLPHDNKMPRYT